MIKLRLEVIHNLKSLSKTITYVPYIIVNILNFSKMYKIVYKSNIFVIIFKVTSLYSSEVG